MELFADENDENKKSQQIHYDDAAIDRLICCKLNILDIEMIFRRLFTVFLLVSEIVGLMLQAS